MQWEEAVLRAHPDHPAPLGTAQSFAIKPAAWGWVAMLSKRPGISTDLLPLGSLAGSKLLQ